MCPCENKQIDGRGGGWGVWRSDQAGRKVGCIRSKKRGQARRKDEGMGQCNIGEEDRLRGWCRERWKECRRAG